jgi:hypothetical protein
MRSASMSRPESVSSRIASFGSSSAIWRISLRFFSPPEKPALTGRFSRKSSISTSSIAFSSRSAQEGDRVELLLAARLRFALSAALQEVGVVDAGDLDRVLERQEHAGRQARSSAPFEQVRRRRR